MKRTVHRLPEPGPFAVLCCPFCQVRTVYNEAMPWCHQCFTEYYRTGAIGRSKYVFDAERKTPRFAVAKAVGKCGGLRLEVVRKEPDR